MTLDSVSGQSASLREHLNKEAASEFEKNERKWGGKILDREQEEFEPKYIGIEPKISGSISFSVQ